MKQSTESIFDAYRARHGFVKEMEPALREAVAMLMTCYRGGGKLLVCGNGGSAADADHIVGELMKAFRIARPLDETMRAAFTGTHSLAAKLQGALPAINLSAHTALVTAQLNDVGAAYIYAQQVVGYGRAGDVLLGISTSGNSENILCAVETARAMDLRTIGMTGRGGGQMRALCELCLCAPTDSTEDVQDMHSTIYHILCAVVENEFWGE